MDVQEEKRESNNLKSYYYSIIEIGLQEFSFVKRNFKVFRNIVLAVILLSIIYAILKPYSYQAKATILPPMENSNSLSPLVSQVGSIAGFAGLTGGNSYFEMYPEILKSNSLLSDVLNQEYRGVQIKQYFLAEDASDTVAVKMLINDLKSRIIAEKLIMPSLLTIKYNYTDKVFAAFFVNTLLERLEDYLKNQIVTETLNKHRMVQTRLTEVKENLNILENAMLEFRKQNRIISGSPAKILEEARLRREIEINNTIYIELMKEYEMSKIQLHSEQPILNILDWASIPTTPPIFTKIQVVVIFTFIGFFVTYILMRIKSILINQKGL